jgi:Flp pilus assembly protein TadD
MDRSVFLPALALLLSIPLSACSTAFEDALIDGGPEYSQFASQQATLRDRAKAAFRQNDFAGAERTFRAALAKDPLDPEAWLGFAAASDRLARFDAADRAYAQVIAIAGRRGEVVNNMGWSQWNRGNRDAAKLLFAEALTLAPGNPVIAANASAQKAGAPTQS